MEIRNPFNADGIVEDFDTAAKLWEYTITSRLTGARQTPASRNGLNDGTREEADGDGDTKMVTSEEELEKLEDKERDNALAEYPLLMSEVPWNPTKAREKIMEIAMEEWGVPAFFLSRNGQLAA